MPHHQLIIIGMYNGELLIKFRREGLKLLKFGIIWMQNASSIGVEVLF